MLMKEILHSPAVFDALFTVLDGAALVARARRV